MSDNEVESFEITDYDLENEFNINRPRRRLTKNQQIYGIWADEEDGDSRPRPGFSGSVGRKNYSTPVSFVSGGVHQAGKKKEGEGAKEDADEEDAERGKSDDEYANSSSSDEGSFRPRNAGLGLSKLSGKSKSVQDDVIAGLRKRSAPSYVGKGLGNWERHTKGIGAKLLLQMGYKPGRGLGKDLQGIAAPIVAERRKGRGAIGAYGPETAAKPAVLEETEEDRRKALQNKDGNKQSRWRKAGSTRKGQYVLKSVEEVLEEGKRVGSMGGLSLSLGSKEDSYLTKVKVIDMTGPEKRVFSGYQALSHGHQRPPTEDYEAVRSSSQAKWSSERRLSHFSLPELSHNLDLVVDMCEQDIVRNDRKMRYAQDRIVVLHQEEQRLDQLLDQEEEQLKGLEVVMEAVDQLLDPSSLLTPEEALKCFQILKSSHPREYRSYSLASLAACIAAPLVKSELTSWKPLETPGGKAVELFRQWRDVLDVSSSEVDESEGGDPYQRLIWEAWVPSIRAAVGAWECRRCEAMIAILERWVPLMPAWILDHVCEQMVLPKIQAEVEEWNPLTDTVPIHAWIHPWLPLLGARLEAVYPTIRQKLGAALGAWHPSDRSAKMILQPWLAVFTKGATEAFLMKHVVPKLQVALNEFVISPHQQHLDQWHWVMEWEPLLPPAAMASLLDKHFFPKWLTALGTWLAQGTASADGVNYEEVGKWYRGWKRMFPESLLSQPVIKDQFKRALDVMNRAVEGAPPTMGTMDGGGMVPPPPPPPPIISGPVIPPAPHGYKEMLERKCAERGILFVPVPNRWQEGKQVYRCGRLMVYLDRNVVFTFRDGVWGPSSLQAVIDAS